MLVRGFKDWMSFQRRVMESPALDNRDRLVLCAWLTLTEHERRTGPSITAALAAMLHVRGSDVNRAFAKARRAGLTQPSNNLRLLSEGARFAAGSIVHMLDKPQTKLIFLGYLHPNGTHVEVCYTSGLKLQRQAWRATPKYAYSNSFRCYAADLGGDDRRLGLPWHGSPPDLEWARYDGRVCVLTDAPAFDDGDPHTEPRVEYRAIRSGRSWRKMVAPFYDEHRPVISDEVRAVLDASKGKDGPDLAHMTLRLL